MSWATIFLQGREGFEGERGHPFSRTGRASVVRRSFVATATKRALDRIQFESRKRDGAESGPRDCICRRKCNTCGRIPPSPPEAQVRTEV